MRLAIPSETDQGLESMRSGHFGHCPYFTICTIEDGQITKVESVKNVEHDAVGCGGVIDFACTLNLDAILTIGMGQPPFMRFTSNGIDVYREGFYAKVGDAAAAFVAGKCQKMRLDEACVH